jgi:hypothetical protein
VLEVQVIQGREIGRAQITEIQALIEANPLWSRWRLSRVLAQGWEWYAAPGQLKDMAARTLLLKLQQRGLIRLPERRRLPPARGVQFSPQLFDKPPREPIVSDLSALRPLRIEVVGPQQPDYALFRQYLTQYHYLSYRGPVGQNLGYLIRSHAGEDLACLVFGAAAWQCAPRDRWIGWSAVHAEVGGWIVDEPNAAPDFIGRELRAQAIEPVVKARLSQQVFPQVR